jgi:hypothetical protein
LLAKANPELNSAEIIYAVTKIEGDGLMVLERRDIVKEKVTSNQSEQIDVEIKKYPTELIGEWWLKSE